MTGSAARHINHTTRHTTPTICQWTGHSNAPLNITQRTCTRADATTPHDQLASDGTGHALWTAPGGRGNGPRRPAALEARDTIEPPEVMAVAAVVRCHMECEVV